MYGRILRHLRESKGRSQADVAKAVAISPAHLARPEVEQRGLYVRDFVSIAEALGEKNRLAAVPPELLPQVTAILAKVVMLAETVFVAARSTGASQRTSRPEPQRRGRR